MRYLKNSFSQIFLNIEFKKNYKFLLIIEKRLSLIKKIQSFHNFFKINFQSMKPNFLNINTKLVTSFIKPLKLLLQVSNLQYFKLNCLIF